MSKEDLFESLHKRNNPTGDKSTKKLDDEALNKLVDTIAPPVKPKKFQVNPEESFLDQLKREREDK